MFFRRQINENPLVRHSVMSLNFDAHVTETNFLEGRKTDNELTRIGNTNNETGSTSSKCEEELIWLDDYKCSLCGVELPSSFVEEILSILT